MTALGDRLDSSLDQGLAELRTLTSSIALVTHRPVAHRRAASDGSCLLLPPQPQQDQQRHEQVRGCIALQRATRSQSATAPAATRRY